MMDLIVVDTNVFINALFGRGFLKNDERILDLEQEGKIKFGFSSDNGDQYFIELAVTINAKYLITNDHQNGLIKLGKYQETIILTPYEYLRNYQKEIRRKSRFL